MAKAIHMAKVTPIEVARRKELPKRLSKIKHPVDRYLYLHERFLDRLRSMGRTRNELLERGLFSENGIRPRARESAAKQLIGQLNELNSMLNVMNRQMGVDTLKRERTEHRDFNAQLGPRLKREFLASLGMKSDVFKLKINYLEGLTDSNKRDLIGLYEGLVQNHTNHAEDVERNVMKVLKRRGGKTEVTRMTSRKERPKFIKWIFGRSPESRIRPKNERMAA